MSETRVGGNQFWLRKLHSLTGFLFLGYFVCAHVRSMEAYDSTVVRIVCLYLPLLFHSLYGLWITYEGQVNVGRYGYGRNWMYLAQRVTGLFLVFFIALHVGAMEFGAGYDGAAWYLAVWYAGVVAAVYHLANGIFGTAIDWGVAGGPHSQRAFVGVSWVAFVVLSAYGLYNLANF